MATPFRLKRSAISGKRPTLNDLQLGELALNTYDAYLYGTRDAGGVGIGTTVTLLTPWTENFGAASIYYQNVVGVGTTNPTSKFTVQGDVLITGFSTVRSNFTVAGVTTTRHLNVIGFTTVVNQSITGVATVGSNLAVAGVTTTQHLNVTGFTTVVNQSITGVLTVTNGIQGIGIQSAGSNIATGLITAINFVGAGNSFSYNSGTKTVDINIGGSQWTFVDPGNPTTSSIYRVNGNVGIGTTNPLSKFDLVGDGKFTGVVTATTFIGALTGIAASATKLVTPRTFEITGDVVAAPISFDGTGNVSLAATIQPNSVGLGTDTFGDYVRDITGTANQITVTGGTGEGSTPIISVPNQFTAPQDVTVTRDLQVNRNLNVNGNITIGGTAATLFTTELKVSDPDIVLGFRTDAFGNDISNDNTANHGGVAIASTEGTPLVQLFIAGIETNPATYKKIMWFKSGTFSGLGTDAWLSNYAIGIGSTQFPVGTRLAAGNVQFTQNDLAVVRNINASGIITAATGNLTTANLTNANILSGIVTTLSGTNLNYSGVGTITTLNVTTANLTNANILSGIVTTLNGTTATYNTANLTNANILSGIVTTLSGTNINYSGVGTIATLNSTSANLTNINSSGITTVGFLTATNISVSGIVTSNGYYIAGTQVISSARQLQNIASLDATTTATIEAAIQNAPNTFTDLTVTGISTLGVTSATDLTAQQLNITGVSTISVNSSTDALRITQTGSGNALLVEDSANPDSTPFVVRGDGNVGIGTTNPAQILHLQDNRPVIAFVETDVAVDNKNWNVGVNNQEFYWQALTDAGSGGGNLFKMTRSTGQINTFEGLNSGVTWFVINNNDRRVGIGTTNPGTKLNVVDNSSSDALRITQEGSGNALVVEDSTNPDATPFVVNAAGSVGIGTTNPAQKLQVYDGSINVYKPTGEVNIQVESGDTSIAVFRAISPYRNWRFGIQGGANADFVIRDATSSANRLGITSAGEVIIGSNATPLVPTGTASQPLQVTGGAYVSGSLGIGTTNPGARLAVGSVQFTENDLEVVRNINASGITTTNNLNVTGVGTFLSSGLKIRNPANTFEYSIVGGAITADRTLNLPVITTTDTVATLGLSQTFTGSITINSTLTVNSQFSANGTLNLSGGSTGTHVFGTNQSTSTLTFGGTSGTGTITLGRATTSQTLNIQAGVTASGNTKTINFGTGGASGSFTQINVGPTAGVGTVAINSGTNLGIGTTNPGSTLTVQGNAYITGVTTSTDFDSLSDINLKTNINQISDPLEKVMQIRGVTFDWKETNRGSAGVIAQEIEKVLPELVHGGETKTVNYNGLIGLLIECVKKQQEEIEQLKKLN